MEIQQYQQTPYCLEEVPVLKDFLLNCECFDDNEAYSHSLQVSSNSLNHDSWVTPASYTTSADINSKLNEGLHTLLNRQSLRECHLQKRKVLGLQASRRP